jgi:methylphosphotriester-DNA--protein-cysteine methyltransferase
LLGVDGRVYQSPTKGLLGANRRGKIYGRLDCPSALRAVNRSQTYARHRVFFADEATAIAAGFRPCAVCMRAAYNTWKAQAAKRNTESAVESTAVIARRTDSKN